MPAVVLRTPGAVSFCCRVQGAVYAAASSATATSVDDGGELPSVFGTAQLILALLSLVQLALHPKQTCYQRGIPWCSGAAGIMGRRADHLLPQQRPDAA